MRSVRHPSVLIANTCRVLLLLKRRDRGVSMCGISGTHSRYSNPSGDIAVRT